jgi:hypothetical protein
MRKKIVLALSFRKWMSAITLLQCIKLSYLQTYKNQFSPILAYIAKITYYSQLKRSIRRLKAKTLQIISMTFYTSDSSNQSTANVHITPTPALIQSKIVIECSNLILLLQSEMQIYHRLKKKERISITHRSRLLG